MVQRLIAPEIMEKMQLDILEFLKVRQNRPASINMLCKEFVLRSYLLDSIEALKGSGDIVLRRGREYFITRKGWRRLENARS